MIKARKRARPSRELRPRNGLSIATHMRVGEQCRPEQGHYSPEDDDKPWRSGATDFSKEGGSSWIPIGIKLNSGNEVAVVPFVRFFGVFLR